MNDKVKYSTGLEKASQVLKNQMLVCIHKVASSLIFTKKVYNKLDRGRKKHLVSRSLARDQPGRSKAGEEKNLQESVRDLFCVPP